MKNLLLLLILTLLIFTLPVPIHSQSIEKADALVSPKIAKREISVGGANADVSGFNNQSIQYAIDAIEKSGGTVSLNPGLYEIIAPVRLKSNVRLVGSGKETVLKRGKGVQTKYLIDADYGELKLTVENTDGFGIGMKVQVTDEENSSCWNVSTAYITDITDNVIYIDKGLIRDYRSDLNGLISNASSVIEVFDAENSSVSNLVIDGNRNENFFADGCNSAGVLILRSREISIDSVHVKDFNGEGISWQITEHVSVTNSEISGSGNNGLHPGTGSPFSLIKNNDVHHNDLDGLFICWRVYQSKVTGNEFHHNGRYGLCTGHKDTDVVFESNYIYNNKSDGVNLREEREMNAPHRNTFIKNIIENNGTDGGAYGFSIHSPARDLVLTENVFRNSLKSQKAAIYIYEGSPKPKLENNQFDKHPLGEVVLETK
ncbi:MAG: right-handed parallel beta-helix repeat-containing protein [Bacteroidales bacterium]